MKEELDFILIVLKFINKKENKEEKEKRKKSMVISMISQDIFI